MGLDDLQAGNTKRARSTSLNAFGRFLKVENVAMEYVKQCIQNDPTGQCFVSIMDKFGMFLAFSERNTGKQLARHTCMQYYRQVKHWLLDQFPLLRVHLESRLLKMGRTLENYCLKREEGGFVRKAPACTKNDLCCMIRYLYTNANTLSDYQDASLLCMMWFMFGRASDLSFVQKQNISIDAGGVFFVRLIRLKTSEEQGLSLFPDSKPLMCPLFTMAVALMTQVAPCADLLDNLPPTMSRPTIQLNNDVPLIDLLDHPDIIVEAATQDPHYGNSKIALQSTLHTHVNRLLDRVAKEAGVKLQLTPHSFRRGGAQFANGSEHLTARWIFDRGAWNVSTTNKGFGYVFNTLKEDHKVAKVLSGHSPSERVKLVDLLPFDSATRQKIGQMQRLLFSACSGLITRKYNVEGDVLEVLIAYLILHYPLLKDLNPNGLAAIRLEACLTQAGCTIPELLAWSAHLATTMANPSERTTIDDSTSNIEHVNAR
ncbi:hypothetical protein AeRB84_017830 [Aphanomyces euteiches]|nr:hypothetical protein AeRB84_017830 [Aphanomyces euteiches]